MPTYDDFAVRRATLTLDVELSDPSHTYTEGMEDVKEASSVLRPPTCGVRRMYWVALAALLQACAMGMAIGYSGPALYDMANRPGSKVKPDDDEATWIGSVLTLGIMLASVYAGPLADRFGRKEAIIFNVVPFTLGWLLIGCANSTAMVISGRFISGMGLGVINVVVPVYCVEIASDDARGLLGTLFMGFVCIGSLLSAVIGSFFSWDNLGLAGAILTAVSFICCLPIPESPRWLISKGHLQRAIAIMDYLQQGHVNAEEECKAIHAELANEPKGRLTMKELLHPTVYKPIMIASSLYVFQQFSGMGAVFYYSSSIFDSVKSFLNPKECTIILCSVLMVSALIGNFIVDRAGRKVLLLISTALTCAVDVAFGVFNYVILTHSDIQTKYSWLPLVILNLLVISSAIGLFSVPCLAAAELVPIRARGIAGGISIFVSNISAFIVTKSFSESNKSIGIYGTFWIYSGFCVLAIIFVAFLVPETKGKKLEDISKIFDYPENRDSIGLIN